MKTQTKATTASKKGQTKRTGTKRAPRKLATPKPVDTAQETPEIMTVEPLDEPNGGTVVENKVEDPNAPIFDWQNIRFDDTVPGIAKGWRYVVVKDDGKNTITVTEAMGQRYKMSRRVFDALPKGKTIRNNRAPTKKATDADKTPRKRAGKGSGSTSGGDDGGKGKGGNRMDQLMDILRRTGGSTVDELAAEMGGLAKHTIRGMVSQMKSKGYPVERQDKKYVATDADKK